ncbi:hypothetical protein ACQ856_02135 [Mycolicibacterium psychrotolerans]|uniref:hypothetical protein n=1 Tax=Mycolicibacterium psychrotolerans TaxID=216929 RepID=UPI003D676EB4
MTSSILWPDAEAIVERAPRIGASEFLPRGAYEAESVRSKPGETLPGARRTFWLRPVVQTYAARFRISKPDGTRSDPLLFSITATPNPHGNTVAEHGIDSTGLLRFESTTDTRTLTTTFTFTRPRIIGEKIAAVLPTLQFLQEMRSPNVLQISWSEDGPFVDYRELPRRKAPLPASAMAYLRAIATLQTYSPVAILVPDLGTVTRGDAQAVEEAAKLIRGETVTSEWTRFRWKDKKVPQPSKPKEQHDGSGSGSEHEIDLASHYHLRIIEPLIVNVGEQELILGTVFSELLSVRFFVDGGELAALPYLNDTMQRNFAPNVPTPDRSHRPVLGKILGPIADSDMQDLPAKDDGVSEELRKRVIAEARDQPAPVGLVFWLATDENPAATASEVRSTALTTIKSLISDGLVELGDYTSDTQNFVAYEHDCEGSMSTISAADSGNFHNVSSLRTGPWLNLTDAGRRIARELAGPDAKATPRHRRFHFAGSGHGPSDLSERIDELFTAEAGQ